jgi:hypothetical protein
MPFLRRLAVSMIGAAAMVFAGCSAAAEDPQEALAEAKRFRSYPVYYAGEEVAGQTLSTILGPKAPLDGRRYSWVFIYGDCDDFPEGEGGCYPPMQIHNHSVCTDLPDFAYARRTLKIRGVRVAEDGEGRLEFSTGTTTVTVGARDRKVAIATIRNLRTVHQVRPGRLPPPIPGALQGKLPCQRVPEKELTALPSPAA